MPIGSYLQHGPIMIVYYRAILSLKHKFWNDPSIRSY